MTIDLKRWLAAAAVLILFFAGACAAASPGSTSGSQLSGGDSKLGDNVNLRDVSIEMQGDTTLVHLSFVNGSRYAGVEETKISSVPSYEITQLNDPARTCVSLAVGFSDFAQAGTVFQESLVCGLFDCDIAGSTMKQLYLQLSGPAAASCSTEGSGLTLTFTPRAASDRTAWFVGLNAMAQYMNGLVPDALGFTPTLCSDFTNQILISRPAGSEQDAKRVLEEAAGQLPSSVPDSALYVFEMEVNGLPPYQSIADSDIAAAVSVMEIDGEPKSLSVLLDNGKYLATAPGGGIVYAIPYLPDPRQDMEHVVKEEIWIAHSDGSHTQIGTDDFYDVRDAVFSADGRYLALLDAGTADQVLYAADIESGEIRNLGEEGLGNTTASFVWGQNSSVLYAMSGTDGAYQLLKYDFDMPEGSRVTSVEERSGSESGIALSGNTLYFADQGDMTIYAVDVRTGERRELSSGTSLRLSGNGRYLAVLRMQPVSEEEVTFDLVLLDAQTGEQVASVIENVRIEDFMFDADGDRLYFITQNYDGVSSEYPFALLRYTISTGQTELAGYSRSELIETAGTPGILYIIYYFARGESMQNMLPVTYVLEESLTS